MNTDGLGTNYTAIVNNYIPVDNPDDAEIALELAEESARNDRYNTYVGGLITSDVPYYKYCGLVVTYRPETDDYHYLCHALNSEYEGYWGKDEWSNVFFHDNDNREIVIKAIQRFLTETRPELMEFVDDSAVGGGEYYIPFYCMFDGLDPIDLLD